MSYTVKKLEKSQVEITFTIAPDDYQKDLQAAAIRISERAAIKGFRPGKAPYDIVKQQVGETNILQEAAEKIIQKTFFTAVQTEKLQTIGMPEVRVEKMAPGNDFIYTATVALLPKVTLSALDTITVKPETPSVGEKEVNDTLDNLKKMQPKETTKGDAATKEDKLVITMDMFLDKVPVEGGHAANHQVYLSEPHYIPGLAEQLVGLKKGDTKEFTLKFPKEHYQKHLADKNVDFKVTVNDVFKLEYPELDDAFAKSLGQASLEKLKELLLANLTREAETKADQRLEIAILDQLIEKTTFEELPKILIDSEKRKMFYELKADLDRRGISMEQYLLDSKTEEDILKDFTEGATKRAKAALISRQVALDNSITVDSAEIEKEVAAIKQAYPGDATVEENLKKPEVLDTVASTLQNRKVVSFLKEKIIGKK